MPKDPIAMCHPQTDPIGLITMVSHHPPLPDQVVCGPPGIKVIAEVLVRMSNVFGPSKGGQLRKGSVSTQIKKQLRQVLPAQKSDKLLHPSKMQAPHIGRFGKGAIVEHGRDECRIIVW